MIKLCVSVSRLPRSAGVVDLPSLSLSRPPISLMLEWDNIYPNQTL